MEKVIFNIVNWPNKILKSLWTGYFYFIFGLFMILLFPFMYALMRQRKHLGKVHTIRKYGCRLVLFITGIWVRVTKKTDYPGNRPLIYIANHTSILDIIVSLAYLDRHFHFIGKHELGRVPFLGVFFKWMDIPVIRGSKKGANDAYQAAKSDLGENISILLFPEGTTSKKAPYLLPFKSGAFKLAIDTGIPLVPISFLDNWKLFHYDIPVFRRPGTCRVVIHNPIDSSQKDITVNQLRNDTFKMIQGDLLNK